MEGVQETLRDVAFLYKTQTPLGGVGAEKAYSKALVVAHTIMKQNVYNNIIIIIYISFTIPMTVVVVMSLEGLLFDTLHWYSPPSLRVTVRVCVYRAVSGSSNTVTFSPETSRESLVQVTVVAGPPVELQVRVKRGVSALSSE